MRVVALMLASVLLYGCGEDEPASTSVADEAVPAPSASASAGDTGARPSASDGGDATPMPPAGSAANDAMSSGDADAAAPANRASSPRTSAAPGTAVRSDGGEARANDAAPARDAVASSGMADEYTIERGDTLASIGKAHGIDAKDLAEWNAIGNPRRLQIGQKIRLSPPGG